MNLLSRLLLACLAGGLVVVAGCNRQEPQRTVPAQERRPPVRPRVNQVRPTPPPTPEKTLVELVPTPSEISEPQSTNVPPQQITEGAASPVTDAPTAAVNVTKRAAKEEADLIFDRPTLLRIQIQISAAGMSLLRRTHWEGRPQRPVAKAIVREGGVEYPNVGVHLKGAAGSFRSVDDKPALTLVFDKFVTGQTFHGLKKFSLNNSVQDPSYLCEKVSRELFLAAGVPVPRAAHALVTLNGRDLGLFVVLEGANKQFLKRYFNNAKGNLYDGGFCQDINPSLDVNCGENPGNHDGLQALLAVARENRPSLARLDQVLDTDRFISMVVLEMMLGHWDGYSLNRNNWRVFHDLESNRMVFIPHGLDQLFGVGRQFDPAGSIKPLRASGVLTRLVLATPEGQRRYLQRAAQIYTNVFQVEAILKRVDQIVAGLSPTLAQTHPQIARMLQQRAGSLKQRIIQRGEGLRRQLGVPIRPVQFASDNVLRLTGWKPALVQSGEPKLSQVEDPPGRPLLAINAGNAISSSSWRTRVVLSAGQYRFEGRVRVKDVVVAEDDQRGGAGLRISKGDMPRKLTGTADWKDYQYPFTVPEEAAEVELVCELRAQTGEAWFDVNSLRLVRSP